ncbi:MAG: thioredoxin [Chloroflexi bacterium RBG_16_57_8]|nr:MAG: thioredoxin [Chloroflexi bacterium RBG_16_57_8]
MVEHRRGKRNRLAGEKSPYLLQHAYNPVDWYPWGPEAIERAKREDKPIFLSIGYSTCHWCHVMAHESFEDATVAGLMNEAFVSIKVDREERPDIDSAYMTVCQMMTGSGGWPLTIIMTADKQPFYAGTYIPKETRFGRIGLVELIPRINELWVTRRGDITRSAGQITAALRQAAPASPGEELGEPVLHLAYEQLKSNFDARHAGFGTAPKFPTPHNLLFLLRYWKRSGRQEALDMVEKTLQAMRRGGIHDHIGFGFHRYSTDERWLAPHFEKMLYDQALLTMSYVEAFQATGKEEYARTAREILSYVLRDMTALEGGFYSAEDADSEGVEGKFYVWTEDEIRGVLGSGETALFLKAFNVKDSGKFADEATGRQTGQNILHMTASLEGIASESNAGVAEIGKRLDSAKEDLFHYREKRVHPGKDDKVLTDWNGLMIVALARSGRVLDEPDYVTAARRAADFILGTMVDSEGRLLHRYRGGDVAVQGNLDDYSFLIHGLLELYEVTFEVSCLKQALDLNRQLIDHFWDSRHGGFFFTADDAEELLVRQKEIYDGAVPSGNSVGMLNLLRLARITADPELEEKASQISHAFSESVRQSPSAHTQLLIAIDFAVGPSYEVVIAGDPQADDTREMLRAIDSKYVPNKVVLFIPTGAGPAEITGVAPFTADMKPVEGRATAYICLNHSCQAPTTDAAQMLRLLGAG